MTTPPFPLRHRLAARAAVAVWLLAAAPALLVTAAAPALAADQALAVVRTDTVGYPDVTMVVAAPPELSAGVLPPSAFQVTEGGRQRPLHVEALAAEQLEVALAVDTSGSMSGAPLDAAKAAARSFLDQLPAVVPVTVVGFGATPDVVSTHSTDRVAQAAAIAGLHAGGETALYDALNAALARFPAAQGTRRAIVLLSDGGDTTSRATLDATAGSMAGAEASLFAVELRTAESNPAALQRLASSTGGKVVPVADPAALAGAFDGIAKQIVRQYALSWRARGADSADAVVTLQSGGIRAVTTQHVERPGTGAAPGAAASPGAGAGAAPASRAPAQPAAPRAVGHSGGRTLGAWTLIVGVAVCFAAMLVGLVELLALRPPRATGFGSRHRWSGLAGIASQAGDLTEEALRRGGQASALGEALERAGLDLRPGELVMIVAASAVAALAGGWLVLGPVPGLALAALVVATAKATVTRLAARRRNRFADQLGETLQLLAGSMRAGHGLAQALDTVGVESESPTAEEFRRLTVETRLGRTLGEALGAMAERMQSADFEWVVQAIEINREVGGDLAEIFDRVGATIRDRNRLRRQVSALSAEGRMSAIVLVCLPFALAGIMAVTNRGYLNELFTSTVGLGMLGAGAALLVAGGAWLRRIIQIDY